MGVTGLWKLVESSGKPVPLESLEGKVLAVDISIWLHQVVKGYQDGKGSQLQNAHILGLFNRICKLLYFRIKPIFVFDGSAPQLKMQTIAKRAQSKIKIQTETERLEHLLLESIAKEKELMIQNSGDPEILILSPSKAIKSKTVKDNRDDLFKLPPIDESTSDENIKKELAGEDEEDDILCPKKSYDFNIHKIDITSFHFRSLPADMRHEILTDLKDTRKQNSWGKIRELPVDSNDFCGYQMKRLLKRRQVQVGIEEAEKEMGGKTWSLSELENLLSEDGVLKVDENCAQRIASNENARFILVRDIANAMDESKHKQKGNNEPELIPSSSLKNSNESNDDEDLELQRAIVLSLACETDAENMDGSESPPRPNLNPVQRKKFSSTIQPHGLVRGFMMEYGMMNTEDINELVESTQDEDLNNVKSKFPLIDDYILNGTQREEKLETIEEISDDEEFVDVPDEVCTEKSETQIEIFVKNSKENFTPEDDIFADIFQAEETVNESVNQIKDTEVASISSDDTETYDVPSQEEDLKENDCVFISEEKENDVEDNKKENDSVFTEEKENDIEDAFESNDSSCPEVFETLKCEKSTKKENLQSPNQPTSHVNVSETISEIQNQKSQTQFELENAMKPCSSKSLTNSKNQEDGSIETPNDDEFEEIYSNLKEQQQSLNRERNKLERVGASITTSMTQDCKELLRLFGIPYIESPMEAEAQCAYLNLVDLSDGTITDDSDILLFGGKTIYKNFFVQKKMVMEFKQESIENKFKLDRKKLIQLAMLVGSDYTLGVNGIGAVTALEILAAFPSSPEESGATDQYQSLVSSLRKFREWFTNGRQQGGNSGRSALRSKLRNIELSENFPNMQVAQAYMDPTIDKSLENFTWGSLEKESLIDYAKNKLGYTRLKTEELLNPVIKKLNEKKQATIKDYFKSQISKKFIDNSTLSKRVQKAIENMNGNLKNEDTSEEIIDKKKVRVRKPPVAKLKTDNFPQENNNIVISSDDEVTSNDLDKDKPSTSKGNTKPKDSSSQELLNKKKKVAAKRKATPSAAAQDPDATSAISDEVLSSKNRKVRIPDTNQKIPQREKDKKEMELAKQKAIEVFKKSKSKKK